MGDDANPCSRTAPCKTFAGAISKTAAAGEINAIDPGGFGGVTITKSISIIAEGVTAGVLVSGTNGVIVNAVASDVVVLRGLDIEGLGSGANGIRLLAGGALYVENSTIHNFTSNGVDVQPSTPTKVFLQNVEIRNNDGVGVYLKSTNSANTIVATINNSRLENNATGLDARDYSRATIRDSVASGNAVAGIRSGIDANPATSEVNVESTVVSANGIGIQSGSGTGTSTIRIANVLVYGNVTGLGITGGAALTSFGNNMIAGNSTDGSPNGNFPLR